MRTISVLLAATFMAATPALAQSRDAASGHHGQEGAQNARLDDCNDRQKEHDNHQAQGDRDAQGRHGDDDHAGGDRSEARMHPPGGSHHTGGSDGI